MRTRVFLIPAAAALLGACLTSPRPVASTPKQYLSGAAPSYVWLTLHDGQEMTVASPRVISDTLFGWDESGTETITIPLADIKDVKARRVSAFRTALIPAAVLAGTGLALLMITSSDSTAEYSEADLDELID